MRRAFTLLEVLISVAIFLLIAGGIYQAVSVAMQASNDISLARLDSERIDSFQRFARLLFSNLPQDARFDLRVRQGRERDDILELLLSPAPSLADFSRNALETGGLALGARPDRAGSYTLCAANFDSEASPVDRDKELADTRWIPLLTGVRQLRWRFVPPDSCTLEETWDASRGRPVMVDLELSLNDGEPRHFQFAVPRLQIAHASSASGTAPAQP